MDYFIAPERIETPDFTIRSYQPGDGGLLSDAVNSSYEHLHPFLAWAKPYQSEQESEETVRRFCGKYLLAQDFVLGIFSADGRRLLGGTGYHRFDLNERNAEIGMWMRADAAGQGLGTRALITLLRWGFAQWPWLRIIWRCDSDNFASARTAQKAGMSHEATLRSDGFKPGSSQRRDTLLFAALRGEWQEPQA